MRSPHGPTDWRASIGPTKPEGGIDVRVLISVDMEGISGVTGNDDTTPGTPAYERFRHRMTAEASAAVAGAFTGGADSVVVNDSHDGMRNILYEELDPRAELISGRNKALGMVEGAEGADAAMFVGYHAWAGTARAVHDHTVSGRHCYHWWLNGVRAGEAQLNAALLAHFRVPVVLACGDDKLCAQIADTLPQARRVIVKHAIDRTTARSMPSAWVLEEIARQARDATRDARLLPRPEIHGPQTIRIQFVKAGYAESAAVWPTVVRVDDLTAEVTGQDIVEAFRMARAMVTLAGAGDR
jgi:D-amino peptidase